MAISVAAARARHISERRFFVWMAAAMAAATFAGFARTYYLAGLHDAPTPLLTPWIHVHGGLCTAWIVMLIAQTQLIAIGRREVHKLLGIAGVVVAAATVLTGFYVALHSHRRVHTAATADTLQDPYVFLIFPFSSVTLFAVFVALGFLKRRNADAHKRLMLLATANLIVPALARISAQVTSQLGIAGLPPVVGAVILLNGFLIAMIAYDLNTRARLHPVTLWGCALVLLTEPLRFVVGFSEPWQAFARMLMS